MTLSKIEIEPLRYPPRGSVIWLHGLGARNDDFVPIVDYLNLREQGIRFIFPQAPDRMVTINRGMLMPSWYDIRGTEIAERASEDEAGILASQVALEALIAQEKLRGIPSHRIFLVGFSQGGAMVLHTGLRYSEPLGGIVALSTYLPLASDFGQSRHASNQKTPIFQAHGLFDPVVPLHLGQACCQILQRFNYPVDWHQYTMAHIVTPEEIQDIRLFLQDIITTWDSKIGPQL